MKTLWFGFENNFRNSFKNTKLNPISIDNDFTEHYQSISIVPVLDKIIEIIVKKFI